MLNWDDLNFFRAIASERSFRRAALRLGLSVNTIRARIDRLENALGMMLFVRGRDGLSLSSDGMTTLDIVLEMDATCRRLTPKANAEAYVNGETLTIGCTEGIGESWLAPRLSGLFATVPVNVSLLCDVDQNRIHSAERDICIGFARPANPETIVCKLATLHFMLCASTHYLERHGQPHTLDMLQGHRVVLLDGYGLDADELRRLVGLETMRNLVVARTNSVQALCQAIAAGVGIGALPTYLIGQPDGIEPLDIPFELTADLWLSFNRDKMSSPATRDAIDWIKGCFRTSENPWFAENFIHPQNIGLNAALADRLLETEDREEARFAVLDIEPVAR